VQNRQLYRIVENLHLKSPYIFILNLSWHCWKYSRQ